ncbi:MAG: hypothetical protein QME75_10520 [Deltaproteobacteria bacterium]|nr:hypothetical protein [Deltaproteobacteria bacterium]
MNYPSVTQVLKPFADFSPVPPEVLDAAAERGQEVHRLCHLHAKGLWVDEVAPECAGYFASFQGWFDAYVERVWLVEERLVCEVLGFTGEPDLVVTLRGDARPSVWDLKTPRASAPTWRVQVSAYRYLARKAGYDILRMGCLRLSPTGGAPILEEYTQTVERDFAVFLSALNCWRFFHDRD